MRRTDGSTMPWWWRRVDAWPRVECVECVEEASRVGWETAVVAGVAVAVVAVVAAAGGGGEGSALLAATFPPAAVVLGLRPRDVPLLLLPGATSLAKGCLV